MRIMKNKHFNIVLLGVGANGSHFLRSLLQDMANYKSKGLSVRLVIADGDQVEAKNIANQLFDQDDVGEYKVQALAERYGQHYGIDILAYREYVTDIETLEKLFDDNEGQRILIGCLDNNRTRQLLHEFFETQDDLIYIDAGVEGVIMKEEIKKMPECTHMTQDQINQMIMGSGFSGQVVTGIKYRGEEVLAPLCTVYPNVLSDQESVFPTQTCAETLNNPQRLETNKMAAQMLNIVMNNLFHTGDVYQHEIQFHARYGTSVANMISMKQEKYFKEISK
ncbi:MAG: ThiF family adenylyltransferase [Kurthia sp.]|nr:ThiF family adenylyltransferase [Candidatus Kurthia equi]